MDLNVKFLLAGTSLVMTVIRSIGNDHGHLGVWCWAQRGQTGKASTEEILLAGVLDFFK